MNRRRAIVSICLFLTTCGRETTELQQGRTPADAAVLSISPAPTFTFDAQIVNTTTSELFMVTNIGKKPATEMVSNFYLSITFTYEGGYPGVDGTCGAQLEPGASCQVRVSFTPRYVSEFEQILPFSYNNGYVTTIVDFPILRGRGF